MTPCLDLCLDLIRPKPCYRTVLVVGLSRQISRDKKSNLAKTTGLKASAGETIYTRRSSDW